MVLATGCWIHFFVHPWDNNGSHVYFSRCGFSTNRCFVQGSCSGSPVSVRSRCCFFKRNSEKISLTTHDMKMTCILDPANDVVYNIWIYREMLFETLNYVRSYAKTCCFFPLHTDVRRTGLWLESGDPTEPLIYDGDLRSIPTLSCMKPLTHIEGSTISHDGSGWCWYIC